METIECPICHGTGKILEPENFLSLKTVQDERRKWAKQLRDKNYSIREIMRLMNYRSPRSITELLK